MAASALDYRNADYRGFVFAVHEQHGLMLLHCTRKAKKGPHFQLPGGHVDDFEFEEAGEWEVLPNMFSGTCGHTNSRGMIARMIQDAFACVDCTGSSKHFLYFSRGRYMYFLLYNSCLLHIRSGDAL